MRFRLLGSSAGKTVPRPFCQCRVCDYANRNGGKDRRTRTGMHIFLNGEGPEPAYRVDLPPDTGHHMMRDGFCLSHLEHLLFTHADADHFDLTYLRHRGKQYSSRDLLLPLTVYGSAPVEEIFNNSRLDCEQLKMRFQVLEPYQWASVGELEVFPVVGHHGEGTLHYVIQHDNKRVLLAWDTAFYTAPVWEALEGIKLDGVFMECTNLDDVEGFRSGPGHLNFYTFLKMRERLIEIGCMDNNTPHITLHMGDNGKHLHSECEELAAPHNVTVGYDGYELEV